jgi:hypothetical protein
MSYRGEDLDLRVPPDRSSGPAGQFGDAAPSNVRLMFGTPARDTTLWVDETLLACCNNAFDLALAHGANEVRIEHLIHAFTQVEAAARILADCGLDVGRLRRDSTVLIVNENPVSFDSSRGPPRRSVEFEGTLRHATELARRRTGLAGVEDTLLALLTSERVSQAVDLVRRLAPDWQSREWAALREPAHAQPAESALRFAASVTDHASNRLDLIEGTLRGIHAEIAGDRKLLSDLVRELHRELTRQRGDGVTLSNTLVERLSAIERQVAARPEPLRALPEVTDKLQSIERAVQGGMGEGARNWAALDKRLHSLEQAVNKTEDSSAALEPIVKRLAALEQFQQDRAGDSVRSWVALADRVQSLEKLYQAGSTEAIRQWSALSEGNAAILKSLAQATPDAPVDAAALTERLELIERTIRSGFGDTVRSNAMLADRVGIVERVVGSRNDTESAFLLDERMRALETALDGRAKETGNRWLELVDRLKGIETRVKSLSEATGTATAVALPSAETLAAPIVSRLVTLTSATEARDDDHTRAIAEIGGRVSALEHVVQANIAALDAAARVYDRNADELHEGFVRLSENQHTLASAIGDWRDDSTTEFRQIAGGFDRLKAVEERLDTLTRYFAAAPARAVAATETVTAPPRTESSPARRIPAIAPAGFWRWLFGTDDIRQANLNAELKWQHMREKVRAAGHRLRKR